MKVFWQIDCVLGDVVVVEKPTVDVQVGLFTIRAICGAEVFNSRMTLPDIIRLTGHTEHRFSDHRQQRQRSSHASPSTPLSPTTGPVSKRSFISPPLVTPLDARCPQDRQRLDLRGHELRHWRRLPHETETNLWGLCRRGSMTTGLSVRLAVRL